MSRLLLQILLVTILMGGTLFCSSSGSGSKSDNPPDTNPDTNPGTNPPDTGNTAVPTLKDTCFSCTQFVTTGDTCGRAMITGTTSRFSFAEENQIILTISDQVELTGTYQDNALDLSHDHVDYVGPGCNFYFTNLKLTATITPEQITAGWNGHLSYDVATDPADQECDSTYFSTCHAVHAVYCDPGCQ